MLKNELKMRETIKYIYHINPLMTSDVISHVVAAVAVISH